VTIGHDMKRMQHKGHKRGPKWRCHLCLDQKASTTCGFDAKDKLFKANHFNCQTLLALKGAMRIVGKRVMLEEERESRGTAWHCKMDDGTVVLCYWKRGVNSGYMEIACQGPDFKPLHLETATNVIAWAQQVVTERTMKMDADELDVLRERIGEDE
jgi:hypothetical protein